jgi:hypothetical protein
MHISSLLQELASAALLAWLISHQYFSLTTNQPPAISQQYFSLRTNQPTEQALHWEKKEHSLLR